MRSPRASVMIMGSSLWILASGLVVRDIGVGRLTKRKSFALSAIPKPALVEGQKERKYAEHIDPTARYFAVEALVEDANPGDPTSPNLGYVQRLELHPGFRQLEPRDRAFARSIVSTTERRLGQIDKLLKRCQRTPDKSKQRKRHDDYCQAALRVGAAQLLFMGVPPHAAVKETVDVLRQVPKVPIHEPHIKYVNAVLRRISREGDILLKNYTSVADNMSPWFRRECKKYYGKKGAKKITDAFMSQAPIFLSVNYPFKSSKEEKKSILERVEYEFSADAMPHGSLRIPDENMGGMLRDWPLYDDGLWFVQDAAATIPALALYNALKDPVTEDVSDLHVVDMCAAPGGKTAQLASLGFGKVTAIDSNPKRCLRLRKNLDRLRLRSRCRIVMEDGSEWVPEKHFDVRGVLLDVPCSATGAGRRQPDVLRREGNLESLFADQLMLACHCADNIVQPGGILVYATCSVLKSESEDQVKELLARPGNQMETLPFQKGEIPGFDDCIDENGWMRVLPGDLDCDGFFVARLRKKVDGKGLAP